jgi:alpha-galactosidase
MHGLRPLTQSRRQSMSSTPFHASPVLALVNEAGDNRCCFAIREDQLSYTLRLRVEEQVPSVRCTCAVSLAQLLRGQSALTLRLDLRPVALSTALQAVSRWWAIQAPQSPSLAAAPVYSTWYAFLDRLQVHELREEAAFAADLGCGSMILDDGWHKTLPAVRPSPFVASYAEVGDWEAQSIAVDELVASNHQLGLSTLLWLALPLCGRRSRIYGTPRGECVEWLERFDAGVLDPRSAAVRVHLFEVVERALSWGVSGLKLDFLERWWLPEHPERAEIAAAGLSLLTELAALCRRARSDFLLEFRQPYIAPTTLSLATMVRAEDCPADYISNRERCLALRALSGPVRVHSDMLRWHPSERSEAVALHLWSSLFCVPQLSIRRAHLDAAQEQVLRAFFAFWQRCRATLLDGRLEWRVAGYVQARDAERSVLARYAPLLLRAEAAPVVELINACSQAHVPLLCPSGLGRRRLRIYDARGVMLEESAQVFGPGLHALELPVGGRATLD